MRFLIPTILILCVVHLPAVSQEVAPKVSSPASPEPSAGAPGGAAPPGPVIQPPQPGGSSRPRVAPPAQIPPSGGPGASEQQIPVYNDGRLWPRRLDTSQGVAYDREIQVIPATEADPGTIAAISRDLRVMLHILEKRFIGYDFAYMDEGRLFADLGQIFVTDDRATKAMYIEGFGALFFMEVNFPVRPSKAEATLGAKKPEDAADQTWKMAEQELFSPDVYSNPAPRVAFDAQRVENLKTELISRLKHASNIQGMKPDNLVIVTVYGGRSKMAMPYSPSALTIRAKKSDIDSFGQGKLDIAQFRQKVEVLTYTPSGPAAVTRRQTPTMSAEP